MTAVSDILFRDARAVLWAETGKARGRRDVAEAAVIWLLSGPDAELEIKPLADEAAECRGQIRTYRQVAILGFAAAVSSAPFAHAEPLSAGLKWLAGLPAVSAGASFGFAVDPVAMLGIALGFQRAPGDIQTAGRQWMMHFVPQSYHAPDLDASPKCLWVAVQQVAGFLPELSLPGDPSAADVRVALRSKDLLPDHSTGEEDERQALQLMRAEWEAGGDPVRAAFRVAAFDWIRRSTPAVLPARMTPEDVVTLLRRIEFALKRWTWEDKPKTKGGTPRRWPIDHEYHVQNLLWTVLAPIFPDLTDEEYTVQLGSKNPRADLGIPSLRLIVEAKFMRTADSPKDMIEQIAQDASLYLVEGSRYSHLVVFVWDEAARSQRHDEMMRSMKQIDGVLDTVVVSRPGDWS